MSINLSDEEKRQLEIDNGLRQYDFAQEAIQYFLEPERPFALRNSLIQDLQRIAVDGIEDFPGEWRKSPVKISKSQHTPPEAHLVPNLVTELCDFVNSEWHEQSPFYLSSFIMWRLNWIHPFSDGNGRTSRMLSYIILCVKLRSILPGSPTIPQQIEANRAHYFQALEAADKALSQQGLFNFDEMENMLKGMLATQLLSVVETANGGKLTP
ncbi:Fic family protein [Magnetovibrio blakemorei]|uniref:Fic family protein n=1 Tax=Magnetovibrio blakemorei TaxID=28181 RepID=UPI001B8D979A|nr:Fic family protein [Magnetovibrio blakemorei]